MENSRFDCFGSNEIRLEVVVFLVLYKVLFWKRNFGVKWIKVLEKEFFLVYVLKI